MLKHLYNIFCGLVFGIANVIPGVSGGTMMVVFNCYDKVCGALAMNLKEIKKNIKFLVFFGVGAVGGILGFSHIITYLFENFPVQTNMFFIGLILGSIPLIVRNATVKEKLKAKCIAPFVLALAFIVGLTVFQNITETDPYTLETAQSGDRVTVTLTNTSDQTIKDWYISIENDPLASDVEGAEFAHKSGTLEKIKSLFGAESAAAPDAFYPAEENKVIEKGASFSFSYKGGELELSPTFTYAMSVPLFIKLMLGGAVAAVAMIIPGVSGSFVMMLLGLYTTIIGAVKSLDIVILIPAAIGIVAGLVFGAKLISWLLKKYSLMVYSVIMGFVIGSVYAILPDGFGLNGATGIGVLCLLVGGAMSVAVGKFGGEE